MTWNRREVLGGLGLGSAQALLWAFAGCGAPQRTSTLAAADDVSSQVREWLRDAVAQLHGAGFTRAQALAVRRLRATAASDVLGASVSRGRADAVVLAVEDAHGLREHATTELTRDGVMAAVRRLAPKASTAAAQIDFGPPAPSVPAPRPDLESLSDASLLDRVTSIARRELSSRIVYAAGLLDIDDATVWSVAKGRDLEQRIVRVRRSLTRVAWNGGQPSASEVARAWAGGIDDQTLDDDQIASARDQALALLTPGVFADGEHPIVLAPSVVATVVEAVVRTLLTSSAARRPAVARTTAGALIGAPVLTLVDDPTTPAAYGGFHFDDEGEFAVAQMLVDRGRLVSRLSDRAGVLANLASIAGRGRRPGHSGWVEPMPSHLRLAPGTAAIALVDGYQLEGGRTATVDPATGHTVIAVARALELKAGQPTGRVYADVELVGDLTTLLGNVSEVSKETRTYGIRDEVDELPRWRSFDVPYLRTAGMLRARRARS